MILLSEIILSSLHLVMSGRTITTLGINTALAQRGRFAGRAQPERNAVKSKDALAA